MNVASPRLLFQVKLPASSAPQQLLSQFQSRPHLPLIRHIQVPRTSLVISVSITTASYSISTAPRPISRLPASTSAFASTSVPSRTSRRYLLQSFKRSFSRELNAVMSSLPPASHPSAACCSIPPVVSKGYQEKGSYEELGGYKTYATGPSDAEKGIVVIFDIFGYYPQTLQGADILATSDKQKYRVFIPDWFKGSPADISWYPPENDEQKEKLSAWFGKNGFNDAAPKVPGYLDALKQKYPNIKSWGVLGFCWGGKVVTLVGSSGNNPFQAVATAHPAFLDPNDAPKIDVPVCILASKDEDANDVNKFSDGLKVDKHIETFGDQIHGWMAARSNLEDKRVVEEYRRGYETVLKFFGKHI